MKRMVWNSQYVHVVIHSKYIRQVSNQTSITSAEISSKGNFKKHLPNILFLVHWPSCQMCCLVQCIMWFVLTRFLYMWTCVTLPVPVAPTTLDWSWQWLKFPAPRASSDFESPAGKRMRVTLYSGPSSFQTIITQRVMVFSLGSSTDHSYCELIQPC